ncbi:MAG: hypothetical protein HQL34_14045 [Alphaproteobacteria bacterium]|nr:hypothetical protein [Alphaproteobacteria bacterium]
MTTEVYSCKDGQALREGKLDYAAHITTKEEAQADAARRCQKDPSLKRIAYYSVSEDGKFRNFYTHNNTNAAPAKPSSRGAAPPPPRGKRPRVEVPTPPSLGQRLLKLLGLGGKKS